MTEEHLNNNAIFFKYITGNSLKICKLRVLIEIYVCSLLLLTDLLLCCTYDSNYVQDSCHENDVVLYDVSKSSSDLEEKVEDFFLDHCPFN